MRTKEPDAAMEVTRERFRKNFPNLATELDDGQEKVAVNSIRSSTKAAERAASAEKNLANFDPDVVDFIRRCDNEKQAEEIIAYMERRGEITLKHAQRLRQQLRARGVRSFGSKKEEGYYFKGSST